ncbi:MAG TPA: ATP-binding cassette domain-containing protein [Pseudonocardiaceae bacterium]|nr:ATP-binding cassette domain-containing protein [Pseudonocardiaceae bacterium]
MAISSGEETGAGTEAAIRGGRAEAGNKSVIGSGEETGAGIEAAIRGGQWAEAGTESVISCGQWVGAGTEVAISSGQWAGAGTEVAISSGQWAGAGTEVAISGGVGTEWAIEATGLRKSYGSTPVLTGLDLRVRQGSVFALLGPNGAGKTTTVRMLATLVKPDGGRARVAGFDLVRQRHQVRRAISLTGQYAALDEPQTGAENLRMMARLRGLSPARARARAGELLQRFDLVDAADRRVSTYSGGMRRRLDLAASLIGLPSVIFLDEPTTGLDPRSRQSMWEVITELVTSGTTVFLTTQYLEEADQLADRIAVVDAGKVIAEGTATDLKRRFASQRLDVSFADPLAFAEAERRLGDRFLYRDAATTTIGMPTDGSAGHIRALLDELDPTRRAVRTFTVREATLDEVFLALTGKPVDQPAACQAEQEITHV